MFDILADVGIHFDERLGNAVARFERVRDFLRGDPHTQVVAAGVAFFDAPLLDQ